MDQGSTMKRSAVHNFTPTVTKFCVMWEGQALPHDTKFGNSRCEIVGRRVIFIWSLIHGLRWSGLIKAEPGCYEYYPMLIFGPISQNLYKYKRQKQQFHWWSASIGVNVHMLCFLVLNTLHNYTMLYRRKIWSPLCVIEESLTDKLICIYQIKTPVPRYWRAHRWDLLTDPTHQGCNSRIK